MVEARESLPDEKRFEIKTENRIDYFGNIISWLIFPALIVLLWFFLIKRMSKGIGGGAGEGCIPCREDDPVAPRTAYGRTKLEGEQLLQTANPQAIIIRTAWLYSAYGNNFVKTMLRLGQERDNLGVVFDQVGTPTYAADLATAIYAAINAPEWHAGIYHFTNEGVCSWYDFTHEIFAQAAPLLPADAANKVKTCNLRPILSSEYQYQTPRPHYSVLDKTKIKQTFGITIPYWTDGLSRCLQLLLK